MIKKCFVFCIFALCIIILLGIGSALAGSLRVVVQCPSSVTAGKPLDVTADFYNSTSNDISISQVFAMLEGSASNTLGLFGPFSRSLSLTIPSGNDSGNKTIRIIDKVPSGLKGKIAGATVATIYNNNHVGSGSCMVQVK